MLLLLSIVKLLQILKSRIKEMAQLSHISSLYHFTVVQLLVLLLLLLPTGVVMAEVDPYHLPQAFVTIPPETVNAKSGDVITLSCVVINRAGNVSWTRDGFGLGDHHPENGSFKTEAYKRYSIPGNLTKGDYSLRINSTNAAEDGVKFECQVGPGKDGNENDKLRAATTLNVVTPPIDVKIVNGSIMTVHENRILNLSCTAYGANPTVQLSWIDASSGEKMSNNSMNDVHVSVIRSPIADDAWEGKMESIVSNLSFKPHRGYNNKTIICEGSNEVGTKTSQIQLEVQYAPVVTLSFEKPFICESDKNLSVSCDARGNPSNMTYRWRINEVQLYPANADTKSVILTNETGNVKNNSIISCEVNNAIGTTRVNKTVNIRCYCPTFLERPKSFKVNEGDPVTLTCIVDACPQPQIRWFHNSTHLNEMDNKQNLTRANVTVENTGHYRCEAVLEGYPTVFTDAYIRMKGPPLVVSDPVQRGIDINEGRVECLVYSVPKPVEPISWSRDGVEIDRNDTSHYSIQEKSFDDGVKSLLIIKPVQPEDFGLYNCSVNNSYGIDHLEINFELNNYGRMVVLIINCITVLEVLVIMIIVVFGLIHNCGTGKRNKTTMQKSLFIDWDRLVMEEDEDILHPRPTVGHDDESLDLSQDDDDLASITLSTRV